MRLPAPATYWLALAVICSVAAGSCGTGGGTIPSKATNIPSSNGSGETASPFRDAAEETGLKFHHFIGAIGEYYLPEITGSGVGLLDYDLDGDLDVFLVQGDLFDPSMPVDRLKFAPPSTHWPGHRLFRNELMPGGKLKFTDVTESAGIKRRTYGMGAAVGDYDNDGDPDLYITSFWIERAVPQQRRRDLFRCHP